jgi:predicted dehydrogenase
MPEKIFADVHAIRPISQVDDYFELLLYYNKLRVRLKASYVVREPLPGYIFHGLKGSFIKPKTDVQETMLQAGVPPGRSDWGSEPESEMGLLHTEKNGEVIREYIRSEQGNYDEYYDGMYQAIRNNKPLPVTAEDGIKVIKIIEAAWQSNESKRVINL